MVGADAVAEVTDGHASLLWLVQTLSLKLRTDMLGNLKGWPDGTFKFIINETCRELLVHQDGQLTPLASHHIILPALSYDDTGVFVANATVGEAVSFMV